MPALLSPYRDVLRRPGALAFSSAGLIARLPIAMIGLGIVLLVSQETGSYGLAGALSAAAALSTAFVGPYASGLVDRWGQHRVVPLLAAGHVVALLLFVVAVVRGLPEWTMFATAAAAGALMPNIGSLVRARWAALLAGSASLRTAFALESILDEVLFVVGPPLATVLALQVAPWAALFAAAVFVSVGSALLSLQRATEPPPSPRRRSGGRPAIAYPGMAVLVVVMVAIGGVFGSFEVVTVAFAQDRGVPGATGLLLALYAFGSMTSGIVIGAIRPKATLTRQLVVSSALLAVVSAPFPFLPTALWVGVGATLAGLAVSPVLIATFALIERLVPSTRLTEGLTWGTSGIGVGLAAAAGLSGALVDASGPSTAYLVTAVSGLLVLAAAAIGAPLVGRAERRAAVAEHPAAQAPIAASVDLVPGPEPGGVRDDPGARS